jgi:hypothetical protein
MIVVDVLREQPLKMAFTKGNHVIEQVSPATADPTLGDSIFPRTSK